MGYGCGLCSLDPIPGAQLSPTKRIIRAYTIATDRWGMCLGDRMLTKLSVARFVRPGVRGAFAWLCEGHCEA